MTKLDFNVNVDLGKMLDKINSSKRLTMLAYCVLVVTPMVIKADDIIRALRWW